MLRIVLPKGSLERATLDLFDAADLSGRSRVRTSTIGARSTIPVSTEVRILRPQEIPVYVAEGMFDLGVTGRDWIEETAAEVVSLGELRLLEGECPPGADRRRGAGVDSPVDRVEDLPQGVRVSTEYPGSHSPLLREEGHRRRHPAVVRRDRGEGA